jgi:hypothetical protein
MKRRREAKENPGIGWTPILAGIGGFAAGATLMGIAAKAAQAQALQTEAQLAAAQGQTPTLQLASSTTSLNNGWMYYCTLVVPGGDLTQAANQTTVIQALQNAGFVDPSTKGAPTLQVSTTAPTVATALTIFNGTTGSSVPASTSTLQWASVLGYPPPEGLATV